MYHFSDAVNIDPPSVTPPSFSSFSGDPTTGFSVAQQVNGLGDIVRPGNMLTLIYGMIKKLDNQQATALDHLERLTNAIQNAVEHIQQIEEHMQAGPNETLTELPPLDIPASDHEKVIWTADNWRALRAKEAGTTTLTPDDRVGNPLRFLRTEDGSLISRDVEQTLCRTVRHCFLDIDQKLGVNTPRSWENCASQETRTVLYHELETTFPFLRLCAAHWKAEKVAIILYARWRRDHAHPADASLLSEVSGPKVLSEDSRDTDGILFNNKNTNGTKRKATDSTASRSRKRAKSTLQVPLSDPADTIFKSLSMEALSTIDPDSGLTAIPPATSSVPFTSPPADTSDHTLEHNLMAATTSTAASGSDGNIPHAAVSASNGLTPTSHNTTQTAITPGVDSTTVPDALVTVRVRTNIPEDPDSTDTDARAMVDIAANAALMSRKDRSSAPTAEIPGVDIADGSSAVRVSAASDSSASNAAPATRVGRHAQGAALAYKPGKGISARNMYGREWVIQNPGGTKANFEVGWKALTAGEKKKYTAAATAERRTLNQAKRNARTAGR
ncbi:hypothetical protein NM688_g6756 [Phlebia brevispora]|uniref:Uncharacterized protein n=1 Tax=Phlebia brevispora TaxID=194682 RepID=A0ACC1SCT1_9APHY|nr:hypothetical protein NM688_g6756 [Phlebia brevispora]